MGRDMRLPLDKLFHFGAETASHMFEKLGYLEPMWVAVNKKGSHVPLLIADMSNKDRVAEAVQAFLKREGATRYVSMLECWTLEGRGKEIPKEIRNGKSLEHNPDRREAITIFAEDNEGNHMMGLLYILRPEHGKPKLSPLKIQGEMTETGGRFARMFD
jgi:hypothetical protein